MLYLYCILFSLKNFLVYEKIDVRLQILKRHNLTPNLHLPIPLPPPPPQNRLTSGQYVIKQVLQQISEENNKAINGTDNSNNNIDDNNISSINNGLT